MANLRLPSPPPKFDQRDEAENRRLIELAFSREQPAAAGGLSSRRVVEYETGSIADLSMEGGSINMGAPGQVLYAVEADRACRLRLYANDDARLDDAARSDTADPAAGVGVFGEFIWLSTHTKIISPPVILFNFDPSPTNLIYYNIENRSGEEATINLTFTVLSIEA